MRQEPNKTVDKPHTWRSISVAQTKCLYCNLVREKFYPVLPETDCPEHPRNKGPYRYRSFLD